MFIKKKSLFSKFSNRRYLNIFLISSLCITILFFLFDKGLVNKYFVGGEGHFGIFNDWKIEVQLMECNFLKEKIHDSCQYINAYGKIFYSTIPFNESLKIFYLKYLPLILIFLFIFITSFILEPINKKNVLIILLCIFNPTTLLLLERLNLDLVIFLILIFISYNKFFYIWFS